MLGMSNKKHSWATAHSQLWTSPAARSAGSRTQSEASSIASPNRDRSLLDDADGYGPPRSATSAHDSRQLSYQPKDKTLIQVSDILESYGAITCDSDIPSVLLHVVKELERAKRDNNFKDLLLREYAGAVERRFGLYGEASPPSVADVSAKLRDGAPPGAAAAPTPAWLEEPLNELRRTVRDGAFTCFEKEVDLPAPILLPDAQRTKANVSQLLDTTCTELAKVTDAYASARAVVVKKLECVADASSRFRHLNLAEALAELEAQQELRAGAPDADVATTVAGDGGAHTLRGALQAIIDAVPASLQIHFGLQVVEDPVLTRCSHLTELVRFLLSEYLSMERYMEGVEAQRQRLAQVFRLPVPSKEAADDDDAGTVQLDDALAQSLRALQETVTAVVTFPHHISEEEYALRRTSAQAVEELAQLLVEVRRSGSSGGGGGGGVTGGVGALPGTAPVRVEPPTQNLLEMVELVKSRVATAVAQQQRRELAGAQGRVGLAHMEESMAKYGRQAMQLLGELATASEDPAAGDAPSELVAELMSAADLGRHLTPAKLDDFLSDVVERLRVVKTRHQRALHAASASKARAEAALQKAAGLQKKLQRAAAVVEQIGTGALGLHFPRPHGSHHNAARDGDDGDGGGARRVEGAEGGRGDGVSALRRLNLRPTIDSAAAPAKPPATSASTAAADAAGDGAASAVVVVAAVTEHNVVESLQLIAARLGTSAEVRDWAGVREEVAQLRADEARWAADTAAFHEAMTMLMQRLARNGQLVKQTLFLLGTDESPKDDLVEEVLRRSEDADKAADDAAAAAAAAAANTVEYVERTLAELLQKYTRWAQRLQQTTEDHLYTQRKIVKYFAAVRRFFASSQSRPTAAPEDIPDDNLYDIDSCLMRAADVILPALDAAIQAAAAAPDAHRTPPATASAAAAASASPPAATSGTRDGQRQEALAHIARDAAAVAAGGVLPYDHRIARLYEGVSRLYTAVTSLMQVRYLSVPVSTRRRSSGETELLFEGGADADANGFVDIDLERLIRVSQPPRSDAARFSRQEGPQDASSTAASATTTTSTTTTTAPPPPPPSSSTVTANNEVILRVTYQNMEVLQDTLKRFSANHKMAAIVLQKDVDAMQQLLAGMLEIYSEVDVEGAFGQSRAALHDLYVTLRDRSQRQKGCYFFNRVGGEGSSPWVTALEHLAEGFRGVVGRLGQRTSAAVELRRIVDEVVDVCAMYLNWAEGRALPAPHAIPAEVRAMCVRDGDAVAADGAGTDTNGDAPPPPPLSPPAAAGTAAVALQRPPKPSRTPPLAPRAARSEEQRQPQPPPPPTPAAAVAKIACFTRDDAVTRVIAHMFQLAQLAVESPADAVAPPHASTDLTAVGAAAAGTTTEALQRLRAELDAAREAAAAAEQRVAELTATTAELEQTRNQAQSEAAVARAELRRWKRQQQQQQQQQRQSRPDAVVEGAPPATVTAAVSPHAHRPPANDRATTHAASDGVVMDEATVREVMAYMKTLSEELQVAKRRVSGGGGGAGPVLLEEAVAAAAASTSASAPPPPGVARRRTSDAGDRHAYRDHRHDDAAAYEDEDDCVYESDTGAAAATVASPSHPQRRPRTYAEVAEQLRHQYGATSLAPMVIVDPQPHAYRHHQRRHRPLSHDDDAGGDAVHTRSGAPAAAASRYSPVKFHQPVYDACDRYYSRELAPAAWEEQYPHHYHPQPQPQPQPRPLTRDAPLRQPSASPTAAQRATPVAASARPRPAATSATRQRRPPLLLARPPTAATEAAELDGAVAEVYDAGYSTPSTPSFAPGAAARRRSSAAAAAAPSPASIALTTAARRGHALGAHHERSTAPPLHRAWPVVQDGRYDAGPTSDGLAAAMRQIDAAAQRPMRASQPTPPRRGSHASTAAPAEDMMSRNANLRATALRRLAEVVSQTTVPTSSRRSRY